MHPSHLATYPSCAHHVRVSESTCPFCRSALSGAFKGTQAGQAPRERLTRAALYALGTAVLALVVGACGSDDEGSSGGSGRSVAESGAGRLPVNHRPSDAQCSTSAPPGDCVAPFPDAGCASDNDCAEAGTNGRCINQGGGPAAPCFCTSDTCSVDTNCPNGQTCACQGAPYTDGHSNTCVTGNCRVDADCGAEYCSPSSLTAICGDSLAGYYCHTATDRCIDDSDCSGGGCVYSTTDSRWECVSVPVCL
jgi:hypothetical protein